MWTTQLYGFWISVRMVLKILMYNAKYHCLLYVFGVLAQVLQFQSNVEFNISVFYAKFYTDLWSKINIKCAISVVGMLKSLDRSVPRNEILKYENLREKVAYKPTDRRTDRQSDLRTDGHSWISSPCHSYNIGTNFMCLSLPLLVHINFALLIKRFLSELNLKHYGVNSALRSRLRKIMHSEPHLRDMKKTELTTACHSFMQHAEPTITTSDAAGDGLMGIHGRQMSLITSLAAVETYTGRSP